MSYILTICFVAVYAWQSTCSYMGTYKGKDWCEAAAIEIVLPLDPDGNESRIHTSCHPEGRQHWKHS
jgi:hypothetical protein